jgi:hypothetical protein
LANKKRATAAKPRTSKRAKVDARSDRIVVHLSRQQQAAMKRAMKRCLERSGKITIRFGKFSITKLPAVAFPPITSIVAD